MGEILLTYRKQAVLSIFNKFSRSVVKKNSKKQKVFRNILIAGSIIILILLIQYILNYRNKIKANKILIEQNEQTILIKTLKP